MKGQEQNCIVCEIAGRVAEQAGNVDLHVIVICGEGATISVNHFPCAGEVNGGWHLTHGFRINEYGVNIFPYQFPN